MTNKSGIKRKAEPLAAATVLGTAMVPASGEVGSPKSVSATPKLSNGSGHKQLEQQHHHQQLTGSSTSSSSSPADDSSKKLKKNKKKKKRKLEEGVATAARSIVETAEKVKIPAAKAAAATAPELATPMAACDAPDDEEMASTEVLPTARSGSASMGDAAAVRWTGTAPPV